MSLRLIGGMFSGGNVENCEYPKYTVGTETTSTALKYLKCSYNTLKSSCKGNSVSIDKRIFRNFVNVLNVLISNNIIEGKLLENNNGHNDNYGPDVDLTETQITTNYQTVKNTIDAMVKYYNESDTILCDFDGFNMDETHDILVGILNNITDDLILNWRNDQVIVGPKDNLEKEIKEFNQKQRHATINSLKKTINELTTQKNNLFETNKNIIDQLNDYTTEINNKKNLIEKLEGEKNKYMELNKNLNDKIDDITDKNKNLQLQKTQLNNTKEDCIEQLTNKNTQIDQLNEQIKTLTNQTTITQPELKDTATIVSDIPVKTFLEYMKKLAEEINNTENNAELIKQFKILYVIAACLAKKHSSYSDEDFMLHEKACDAIGEKNADKIANYFKKK